MHKLTLCMIVKNENVPHFKECLESVSPYIDYYVIEPKKRKIIKKSYADNFLKNN